MAISTEELLGSSVIAIEELRGEEWWKQGVDKEICVEIFEGMRYGDMQWISWSKIQKLLREEKRAILEEIKPELRERRLAREVKRENERMEKRYQKYLISCGGMTKDEKKSNIHNIRQNGKIIHELPKDDICFNCGNKIPKGSFCIAEKIHALSPVIPIKLCSKCVVDDQERRKKQGNKILKGLRKIKRSEVEVPEEKPSKRFSDRHGNVWVRIDGGK